MQADLSAGRGLQPSTFDPNAAPDVKSWTEQSKYIGDVDKAKEYIRAGDAFQIVLSQRFSTPCSASALDVYRILRTTNPSPYMYLVRVPELDGEHLSEKTAFEIVGSSPEALVTVEQGHCVVHPIAGTRKRGVTVEEDAALAEEMLADVKERAEHLMLVDLARNDLGRVSAPGSVQVIDFMQVERYSHVMHLVSTVTSELADGKTAYDALAATFPAGTLSGAPKPRAMAIIDELEPLRRGIYGGCVGYFDFAGNIDTAIAIRTAVVKNNIAYVQAGAGIVADSVPELEDAECRNKAAAVLRAVAIAATLQTVET
jgi:anthranilate synthase component 1